MLKKFLSALLAFILIIPLVRAQGPEVIRIGILTDVQYCDCPTLGARHYRLSLAKLDSCVRVLNELPLVAVYHLGDMTDRYETSFDSIAPIFARFTAPVNYVLGNHEFMVETQYRNGVVKRIGLTDTYYSKDYGKWRIIVLNGNDLSFFAPQTKSQRKERNKMITNLYLNFHFNGLPWNGGIGSMQMKWLNDKLHEADSLGLNAIVMCHFPLYAEKNHILFNNQEVINTLIVHPSAKAYFCGHYHDGGYKEFNGIHHVNFKGMVNTTVNSFAELTLTTDSIIIKGYGREPDRKLKIR